MDKLLNYTVIDTETTGLFQYDRIIEVAAARVRNGKIVETFETLINPQMKIGPGATAVNGITNEMVKDCPTFDKIESSLLDFLGRDVLVGHNIGFDLRFLNRELENPLFNPYVDTLTLARRYVHDTKNHKLATLVHYFGFDQEQQHRALGDVELTYLVFEKLMDY